MLRIRVGTTPTQINQEPSRGFWTHLQDVLSAVQAFMTILAILAAGWWFLFQREAAPKATIAHEVTHRSLTNDWTWVHLTVTVTNIGQRRLYLPTGTIRIKQVLPLDRVFAQRLSEGRHLIEPGQTRVVWPRIGESYRPTLRIVLEAGESDTLYYEFIIPSLIETVRIYTYFATEATAQIGWSRATIYNLKP